MSEPRKELGALYEEARHRISSLASTLTDADAATPVPACPGWTVHDVIAHLTASAEDVVAGRLGGPPSEEHTAEQVARHRHHTVAELLEAWSANAAPFADVITAAKVWPGLIDCVSHEHDIRGALGRPADRDSDGVQVSARALLRGLQAVPIRIETEDAGAGEGALTLKTTTFELLRWRMGRRSRAQLAAMEWNSDPAVVLDQLCVFGPSPVDIIE